MRASRRPHPRWSWTAFQPVAADAGLGTAVRAGILVPRKKRSVAFDRDSVAAAYMRVVVPERMVLDAPVVPEGDRVVFPREADMKLGRTYVIEEELEEGLALLAFQSHDTPREAGIDKQCLTARDRVGTDHRVYIPGIVAVA